MDRIARAEAEQDPQKRVKIVHDLLRGMRGPQEKLAFVAIDDDPEKGFVYEVAEVRKEAANIGRQTQEGYLNDDPSLELEFEALMDHFMEKQEELKAPGSTQRSSTCLLSSLLGFSRSSFSPIRATSQSGPRLKERCHLSS